MAGQPDERFLRTVNAQRLQLRVVDELIGMAKAIVADNVLNNAELEYLVRWLVANREITSDPLVAILFRRIEAMLADGIFDDDERAELLETLRAFGSETMEMGEVMKSTSIPFTAPAPQLSFEGVRYCFTGTFKHGTRAECEATISKRGGMAGSLTKDTDALVVGYYATESWLHSSYGRKIMKAADLLGAGHPIVIVSEDHWAAHL
jgi:NAD-dependent DNA ligase